MSHGIFWKKVGIGTLIMVLVIGITGAIWYVVSSCFVAQRGYQAKYLLVLSQAKSLSKLPKGDAAMIKPLIILTNGVKDTKNPEQNLVLLLKGLDATASGHPGSWIVQLTRHYPGEINKALQGDSTFAKKLWALYLKTKGVKFFPFWMVLIILAALWILAALDFAAYETAYKNYRVGHHDGYEYRKKLENRQK